MGLLSRANEEVMVVTPAIVSLYFKVF
jgi:hypothetical protein